MIPIKQSWEVEHRIQASLKKALKREKCLWKQKSQVGWLTTPNLNTKFFHLSMIIWQRRNIIGALKTRAGVWLQDREAIEVYMVDHFQRVYTSSTMGVVDELDSLISPVINEEDNVMLYSVPSREDIQSAASQIGALIAPGPNGMSAIFHQHY